MGAWEPCEWRLSNEGNEYIGTWERGNLGNSFGCVGLWHGKESGMGNVAVWEPGERGKVLAWECGGGEVVVLRWSHFSGHECCLDIASFPGLWPKFF